MFRRWKCCFLLPCIRETGGKLFFAYVGSAKIASEPAAVFSRVGKMLAETALAGFLSEPRKVSAVKLFAEGEQQISFFPFGKKITDGTGDDVKDSFFLI